MLEPDAGSEAAIAGVEGVVMKKPNYIEAWMKLDDNGDPMVNWTIWLTKPLSEEYKRVVVLLAEDFEAMETELDELRDYKYFKHSKCE